MKKLFSILLVLTLLFSFSACGTKKDDYTAADISVACMTGPTGIGMAKLIADSKENKTANNYTFTVADGADKFKEKFLKGEIQIASVPTNLAASLYNATDGKIRMLAVNTNGVLSIIQNGDSYISSLSELKGKTLYAAGAGQNPEYILKYILEKNNLVIGEDITVIFEEATSINKKLLSGEAKFAMLPEPAASTILTKSQSLKKVLSINDEWSKVSENDLMIGCVIALDDYVNNNKAAVEKFLEEYEASIKFAKENVDAAAVHCAAAGITTNEAIAKKAIPDSNLCFITKNAMKDDVNAYLSVLFAGNPKLIGGALPANDLYYNAD